MTSTAQDRLHEFYQSYADAYRRRADDLAHATSAEQALGILDNVSKLEGLYLAAAQQALDANGAAIDSAFEAAQETRAAIDAAYAAAKGLAEKIRLVASVAGKLQTLLEKLTPTTDDKPEG